MCSIRIAFLQAVSGYYRLGEGNYGDIHGKCEESDYTREKHIASKRWTVFAELYLRTVCCFFYLSLHQFYSAIPKPLSEYNQSLVD